MLNKLEKLTERYHELNKELSDPDIFKDREKSLKLTKEQKELEEVVRVAQEYKNILNQIEGDEQIIEEEEDRELREIAEEELEELNTKKESLEEKIKMMLVPKDPQDSKNAIMEIRAGTG
ncbi:PCRF domain-containing protein, partial [candidate division KSB1 bacterium]|nr:PCRF domain-containing protein [candidate division KSB1 bacterium]